MSTNLPRTARCRWLLSTLLAVLAWRGSFAQAPVTATIGTGTASASTNALLSTSTTTNKYSRTLSIYSAAELTAAGAVAGSIVSVAWFKDGTGEYTTGDATLSIYMKNMASTTYSVNPVDWATEVTGATQVYTNTTQSLPTGTGYKTFALSTPFVWNGTSNVAILVDWFRNSAPTADIRWQYTAVGTTGINATQVNSVAIPTVRFAANRPNVQLVFSPTGAIICNPATAVAAGSITSTGASIGFTASGTATSYTVTYTAQGGTAQTVTGNPTASPVALTGLQPGTQYSVSVVSNCAGGQTAPAAITTFTTLPACTAPTAVTTTTTSTTARVTLTAPTPAPASYTVTYAPTAGGTPVTATLTTVPFSFSGLQPGTAYNLSIVSNCGGGQTSAPVTVTFTTLAACNAPTGLTTAVLNSTAVSVAFTAPTPAPASYTVTYVPTAGGTPVTVSPAPTSSPVTISNLQSGTAYSVTIVSNCGGGQTSAAASDNFTTAAPCNAPSGLTVSGMNGNAATLFFSPPAGTPSGTVYQVLYTPAGGTAQTVSPSPTASPVRLTGLLPNTSYVVSIRTICTASQTSAAATVTFSSGPLAARESLLAARIGLYPNPAHRHLTVQVPAELTTRPVPATLTNALGQTVRRQTLPGTATGAQGTLEVSALAAGMYTLQLELPQGLVTKRVVVE